MPFDMRTPRLARQLAEITRRILHRSAPRFRKSVYGPLLLDTPGDRTFELCLTGYGPFVAERIAGYERDFLFLDIGANLGLFSLLADRHPLCRKVLALEPLPAIFANLCANLERNRAVKVAAHCCAISEAGRHVEMSYNPAHSGMSKIILKRGPGTVRAKAVNAAELDRLIGDPQGDIVAKIDVEGSELAVLSILQKTRFYRAIKAIIIEISENSLASGDKADLLALLGKEGFVELSRAGSEKHYDAYYVR
jgi:FkbM family methyltransferase